MPHPLPAARRLSQALTYPTVSHQDITRMDLPVFSAFEAFLEAEYPLIHHQLTKTVVNGHGLVFHWPGRDRKQPILLTAHYDVVPAGEEGWPYPPFSGHIADDRVYGRGSFDDKGSLIAIMEAVTALLLEGFEPPCDIYLAFGYDEEVGGAHGAQRIAAWFEETGMHFDYGIKYPVAVIGVAEKGNTSFALTFQGEGGHSSTPPHETAVSTMARLIRAVQERPAKPRLTDTVKAMLKATAPYRPGIQGFVLAHPDLFAPLIIKTLQKNRQTAAMLRTTAAFTMTSAGTSHNVLPTSAACTVNLRILQGDTSQQVLERFRSIGIPFEVTAILRDEPTKASDVNSPAMDHLRRCIAAVFPDAVITPYLMTGGTDCRHYDRVTQNAYRFQPARVSEQELSLMHGRGEYLSLQNLGHMIDFYTLFIKTLS